MQAGALSGSSYVRLFATSWAVAHQAPLSMGFSRQEYWSGLPCPPPGDLPDSGIEVASLTFPALAGSFFTFSAPWEGHRAAYSYLNCKKQTNKQKQENCSCLVFLEYFFEISRYTYAVKILEFSFTL